MIKRKHLSSSEDSQEETVEEIDAKKLVEMKKNKQGRSSVSAEAYGQFNKKGAFKAKVIAKNEDQALRIRQRLNQAFMFQALDEKELKIVIDAMDEKKFNSGEYVIKQGEDGDNLYVVDSGALDCTKVFKKGDEPKYLKTYKAGESFGELSLLYNAPRAASIKAISNSVLFSLDRETFNNIVKDSASKKREYYEEFLSKVELLSEMDPYERLQIADALKSSNFKKGDYIIKQGDTGNTFYLLQSGKCVATKGDQVVFNYKSGDYFGELALLKNEPRAANIIADSDCTCVHLDSASFRRLIGPVEDILKRNTVKYAKFVKQ